MLDKGPKKGALNHVKHHHLVGGFSCITFTFHPPFRAILFNWHNNPPGSFECIKLAISPVCHQGSAPSVTCMPMMPQSTSR